MRGCVQGLRAAFIASIAFIAFMALLRRLGLQDSRDERDEPDYRACPFRPSDQHKWWGLFLTDAMGTSKIIVTSQVLSTMDEEICKGDQLHTKLCSRAGCFLDKPSQLG